MEQKKTHLVCNIMQGDIYFLFCKDKNDITPPLVIYVRLFLFHLIAKY